MFIDFPSYKPACIGEFHGFPGAMFDYRRVNLSYMDGMVAIGPNRPSISQRHYPSFAVSVAATEMRPWQTLGLLWFAHVLLSWMFLNDCKAVCKYMYMQTHTHTYIHTPWASMLKFTSYADNVDVWVD
jgi:hypothetical protein